MVVFAVSLLASEFAIAADASKVEDAIATGASGGVGLKFNAGVMMARPLQFTVARTA